MFHRSPKVIVLSVVLGEHNFLLMVIISEMKHNAFKEVSIPRPSKLVAQFGLTRIGRSFSGDEYISPSQGKIEQVSAVAKDAFEKE